MATKETVVNNVAEAAGLSKKDTKAVIDAFLDEIIAEVKAGEAVQFVGFGTFKSSVRAAREGHNPQDPTKKIQIPERKVPSFKAGKAFKDALN